jgi:Protein of unknown function (DUF1329)
VRKKFCGVLISLVCLASQLAGAEVSPAIIQRMFYPYASGMPSADGLAPGATIAKDSWEPAKDYLPPEILEKIKAGEFAFTVQETTNLPVSEAYIEATRQHAEQVKIGADGELEGYVAGLPFPVLDLADPQAGLKAAWDLRYRDFGDSMQVWNTFRIVPESGSAEREIENYYVIAYGMHRPQTDGGNPNKWEKDGILYKEFYHLLSPFDLKNTMSLKHRYVRDQANDDNWMYTPASRKIRKVIIKQEEAQYDSGLLTEDNLGFWGYVRSYNWKFLGFRRLLAPVGAKVANTTYGGRGGWYPVDPWELREMLVLEGTPKASDHPHSKRVLYIDQQMFVPVYTLCYDREGKHQKTQFDLYGNPKFNPGNEQVRVPLWIGESMIDYENRFGSITVVTRLVYNLPLPDDFFNLDKIAARGQ